MMPKVSAAPRSKMTALGMTGTTWWAWSGAKARSRSANSSTTPSAALSPYALPPERQMASTLSTRFIGERASVSRARTSASNLTPGGTGVIGENDGGAGSPIAIRPVVMADADASDVGKCSKISWHQGLPIVDECEVRCRSPHRSQLSHGHRATECFVRLPIAANLRRGCA